MGTFEAVWDWTSVGHPFFDLVAYNVSSTSKYLYRPELGAAKRILHCFRGFQPDMQVCPLSLELGANLLLRRSFLAPFESPEPAPSAPSHSGQFSEVLYNTADMRSTMQEMTLLQRFRWSKTRPPGTDTRHIRPQRHSTALPLLVAQQGSVRHQQVRLPIRPASPPTFDNI